MRLSLPWALALASTTTAANLHAANKANNKPAPTSTSKNPCNVAKAAAEYYLAASPSATVAFIEPSLAYNCLNAVAVDKERDLDLLNYLEPYIAFQSTLEPLADPPKGYLIPGVDVIAGFGQIRAKLMKGHYKSQLDFALELRHLFSQASDGHFLYKPALLSIFGFISKNGVVSVADEANGLPSVYLRSDFEKDVSSNTDVYDIESIDGVPVHEFLEAQAARQLTQDPDAKYNKMFSNPAMAAQDGGDAFTIRFAGNTPDQEVIKFTNGTTYVNKLYARISKSALEHLNTPEELHEFFEVPATRTAEVPSSKPSASKPTSSAKPSKTALPGYPKPVSFHAHEWVSGYFLEGKGYEDVAVLAVLSFSPWSVASGSVNGSFEIQEARRTVAEFLKEAKKAGKKKLVIDLQGNGGGYVVAGFQLYNQLFPKAADIWDGNRLRANEALNALGATAADTSPKILDDFIGSFLDEKLKPYETWGDLYGPQFIGEQNVTNLLRFDHAELGYPKSKEDQLFDPKNIVVVTDGGCASTCTIFTGLLVREHGVRTIALGGRPLATAMQAVGGVEGAQVLDFIDLQQVVMKVGLDAVKNKNTKLLEKVFDDLPDIGEPPLLPPLANAGAFNYRNAYSRKNVNGYPEQFRYEAANCRLFYTEKMVYDPVAIWSATADAAWGKGKCVAGSTVNTDGTISDKTVDYNDKVVSGVAAYKGPGSLSFKGDYEPPKPFIRQKASHKRSIEDQLTPPDGFEYQFKQKIGDIKEYFEENVPGDWEYKEKPKWGGFSRAYEN
ncbi:peptidase s41 family protein [Colletotrichum truncatum]|uniref:Peptidase s41 family protein n=1 Tax=Colletotrichum truncatum TaxID=5467 RepID=A0ACC3YLG5_COLTU|nr:peptidase s41 family protein [Colletotrichum truncatum]KAF6780783.1 peptidase s41 family protein [Colletotrichum truncatum]